MNPRDSDHDDPDRPGFGDIYTPANMEIITGEFELTGWVIDYDRAEDVEIWVDGVFVSLVDEFGLETPEVEEMFPWLPMFLTRNAGWTYVLDTVAEGLADGEHVLVVQSVDDFDNRSIIGERRFVVDNPS